MSSDLQVTVITVRFRGGTHRATNAGGLCATATAGFEQAARALCRKVYGDRVYALGEMQGPDGAGIVVFEARCLEVAG